MKNNELTEVKSSIPSLEGLPQEVIEYVHGLVAENASLKKFCKDASFNADYESELGMERGGFTDALGDIKTPNTDAFTAELRAQGVDEAALTFHEKAFVAFENSNEYGVYIRTDLQQFAANLRAGRKG
jgi:hypothetical protein